MMFITNQRSIHTKYVVIVFCNTSKHKMDTFRADNEISAWAQKRRLKLLDTVSISKSRLQK